MDDTRGDVSSLGRLQQLFGRLATSRGRFGQRPSPSRAERRRAQRLGAGQARVGQPDPGADQPSSPAINGYVDEFARLTAEEYRDYLAAMAPLRREREQLSKAVKSDVRQVERAEGRLRALDDVKRLPQARQSSEEAEEELLFAVGFEQALEQLEHDQAELASLEAEIRSAEEYAAARVAAMYYYISELIDEVKASLVRVHPARAEITDVLADLGQPQLDAVLRDLAVKVRPEQWLLRGADALFSVEDGRDEDDGDAGVRDEPRRPRRSDPGAGARVLPGRLDA